MEDQGSFRHRLLMEEAARRIVAKQNIPDVLAAAFPQQRNAILHPSKRKTIFCTRRAAKSFTDGLYLTREGLHNDNCNTLFIGLTRASAKAIIWKDVLQVINAKYDLNADFNKADLTMALPNGSMTYITGIDADEQEMNKLLGRKFRLVCVDEASMYTVSLSSLINLLEPAMVDPNAEEESGTICLSGTASNFPRGLFYDITIGKEKGWQLFQWTAYDNPYVAKQWDAAIKKIEVERPLYMETPQYKQWYLNKWEVDEEKLVYRFDHMRNLVKELPKHLSPMGWTFVLGVDTGWEDESALVLTGYHIHDPQLYVIKTFAKSKMTFDDLAAKIQEFMSDPYFAPHKVIIDGANKQGVESMRQRSSIPFEYADKQDKVTFIELCNSDLIQGSIKILDTDENRPLWNEMMALVWVSDGDKIKYPKKEHPNLSNHRCFIAGTKIMTPIGERNIEDLHINDLVETRNGPRRIQNTITSKANVITLKMSDGTNLTCTPDHPFWCVDKWIEAKNLTASMLLSSWNQRKNQAAYGSMGLPTIGLFMLNIIGALKKANPIDCIKRFGDILKAKFLKAFISIIKIIFPWTIDWRTSKRSQLENTPAVIPQHGQDPKKILNFWKKLGRSQKNGINQKKEDNGIANMERKPLASLMLIVLGVRRLIQNRIFIKTKKVVVPQNALQANEGLADSTISNLPANGAKRYSSQTNIQKENAVVCIAQDLSKRIENVYNITVETDHEYYANGILVSNCDAFLYAWRCGYHYAASPAPVKLVIGSHDWYKKQAEDIWTRERERLEHEDQKGLWPGEGSLGDLG